METKLENFLEAIYFAILTGILSLVVLYGYLIESVFLCLIAGIIGLITMAISVINYTHTLQGRIK